MTTKYFTNSLEDFNQTGSKYLDSNLQDISVGFKTKIEEFTKNRLEELLKEKREIFSSGCVYTGSAGIGLLLYHIAKRSENREAAFRDILQYVDGERRLRDSPSFLCGAAGPLALGAVLAFHLGESHAPYVQRLEALAELAQRSITPDELLYGRAGYLYALLFLNQETGQDIISPDLITQVVQWILASGQQLSAETDSQENTPLLYIWHDSYYLGAAHGTAGILYLLLQALRYLPEAQLRTLVVPTLRWLLQQCYPSGNLPSSLGSRSDRLVQWCHGAPGLVQLLCLAHQVTKEDEYLNLAIRCGDVVWERGLCSKGYSLCHGVAGNAYTFLQLHHTTGNPAWLHRAAAFADWCVEQRPGTELHRPDRPASLFEGLAGRLYFLYDMLRPLNAKFPAYTI